MREEPKPKKEPFPKLQTLSHELLKLNTCEFSVSRIVIIFTGNAYMHGCKASGCAG